MPLGGLFVVQILLIPGSAGSLREGPGMEGGGIPWGTSCREGKLPGERRKVCFLLLPVIRTHKVGPASPNSILGVPSEAAST